jgi:hypothetical protein
MQVLRLPADLLLPTQLPEAALGRAQASVQGCEGSKDSISTAGSIRKQCVAACVVLSGLILSYSDSAFFYPSRDISEWLT